MRRQLVELEAAFFESDKVAENSQARAIHFGWILVVKHRHASLDLNMSEGKAKSPEAGILEAHGHAHIQNPAHFIGFSHMAQLNWATHGDLDVTIGRWRR